jgi:histidine triad (HIT) family protein
MPLSEQEVKQVKEQLFKQIEAFPPEQRDNAKQQIEAMNAQELEEFIIKNNLVKGDNCIFCSIASGETPSYKIAENNDSVAILDINPLSEGQVLVIPKQHKKVEESSALRLAQEVAKLLKEKLNASDVKIESTQVQGHGLVNVIPIYDGKQLERKKADDKQLYELQQKLTKKPEAPKPREVKEVPVEELPHAPVRIP